MFTESAIKSLKSGGVGIIPTDTLYGIVARAHDRAAVERVYEIKGRSPDKPCIILINRLERLSDFGISLSENERNILNKVWPGKVSVILPCTREDLTYLHRGTNTLAFRLPVDNKLQVFLSETGPLIAPSSNREGKSSAKTITEARDYFGEKVDFYIDGGELLGEPSTLIEINDAKLHILRAGSGKIPKELI